MTPFMDMISLMTVILQRLALMTVTMACTVSSECAPAHGEGASVAYTGACHNKERTALCFWLVVWLLTTQHRGAGLAC